MSVVHIPEAAAEFHVDVREDGSEVVIRCAGTLEGEVYAKQIQPELLKLHESLLKAKAPAVRLELHEVDYMSSSAIKVFACWFVKLAEAVPPAYEVRVTYDPCREWQAWSLSALRMLAPGRVGLEPLRRSPSLIPS